MLNKEQAKQFQRAVAEALDMEKLEGATLKDGSRASYDPTTGEIKVTLRFIVGDEEAGKRAQWEEFSRAYGLAPEDLGKTFTSGCNTYTITGCNPGGRKRPILAVRQDTGKEYVFPVAFVTKQLRPWNVGDEGGIFWYDAEADALRQASHAG